MESIAGWCPASKATLLAQLVAYYHPLSVLELGVFAGKSLCVFGQAMKELGRGLVIGVDSWRVEDTLEGEIDPVHRDWWATCDLEAHYTACKGHIDRLGLRGYVALVRASSEEAGEMFAGATFDMMHIDASKVSEQMVRYVHLWVPKLRVGGLLVLDDTHYGSSLLAQVVLSQQATRVLTHTEHGHTFSVYRRD